MALCHSPLPERTGQQRKPWHPCFVQAKDEDMRDFRDAKAMARTLRAALVAKGLKITVSQSLELIAEIFGEADWNTLAAAIRAEGTARRNDTSTSPPPSAEAAAEAAPGLLFSRSLESALHRAVAYANQRKHEFATLEHLLLALTDDEDASAVMKGCKVDLAVLKGHLSPTACFQRVIQRAVIHVQSAVRKEVTGADVLVAIFAERESHAAYFLTEHDVSRYDAVNYLSHGIVKRSPIPPEAEEKGKPRPS
jgi:Glyoxalase superfamily protein/Clp amino terminal domain, pathogenicity island component